MASFALSLGFQWTPPGAPANSGNSSIVITGNENAQNIGKIDVPPSEPLGTTYNIPLGSINDLKTMILQNGMASDLEVYINGSVTPNFELSSGQIWVIAGNAAPSTIPITSVSVRTTAVNGSTTKYLSYWLAGD